ncbi:MAG: WG repeat-containing protein [Cyclobacteriaceae bacterium]
MWRLILFGILFLGFMPAGNLDRIRRAFEKLEYEKAYELILRAYEKDSENAGAIYYAALIHATDSFDGFDLDTARTLITLASQSFVKAEEDVVEDLAEDGVTQEELTTLSESIRDRIYTNTSKSLSVSGAEKFMRFYPDSPYQARLIFQRDSIVFDQVRRNDLLGVYEDFLKKHSTTEFREIAINRIDELRYQVLTHSGTLQDYYQFLKKYPRTKFRANIEAYIFRISCVDHQPQSYIDFIAFASEQKLRNRAADILYYIQRDIPFNFTHTKPDSIQEIERAKSLKLIPAMEGGKFGFHKSTGQLQIPYSFGDVGYEYKCDVADDDWLFVSIQDGNQIINKNGEVIIEKLDNYTDLSFGAAIVEDSSKSYLYHKSGFKILETPIAGAEVMSGRWIRVLRNGKWALVSYSGELITDFDFSDIRIEGSFWIFEKNGLVAVYTEELIEKELRENGLDLEFKFDDLELVSEKMLIGFRGDRECMLDDQLNFLVPWGEYEIKPDESRWYLKTSAGYRLYDHSEQGIMNQVHPYLETNFGWLALKTDTDWILLPKDEVVEPSRGYDSLKLLNEFCAFAQTGENQKLIFTNGTEIDLSGKAVKSFFNKPSHLLIADQETRSVIDSQGIALLQGKFEEITFFNDSLLKVKLDGKNGLLKLDGTYMIDLEYDAIDEADGLILCLKGGAIGCVDLDSGTVISPNYEARIERLGPNYLVKMRGKFGVINSKEDSILSFSYDEIKFWNDTSFLARKENSWNFLNHSEEEMEEPIEFLTEITSIEEETIWKYVKDGKYGLVSNLNGFLLAPEFTDVYNIGSDEEPVFFADQNLAKAEFHVVSYIDRFGELILSKAYTKEEFDKILCDD